VKEKMKYGNIVRLQLEKENIEMLKNITAYLKFVMYMMNPAFPSQENCLHASGK
jgi:hypothetical protein